MDHTVVSGDELIIWWPNGHGYDVYRVVQGLDRCEFIMVAEVEIEAKDLRDQL
jgi:hypothetical protein